MSTFKSWMLAATPAQQQRVADVAASGSRQYLYQWANGHRTPDPTAAAAIERETQIINRETEGALPVVWRVDLNRHCGACSFAAKCMAEVAK